MASRAARAEGSPYARRPHAAPLTVAAVAARLGVAASTLRTWDRRYGLGPSAHEAGSHRRYTPSDVDRLERMRQLTLEGVAPADAARIAAHGEQDAESAPDGAVDQPPRHAEQLLVDPLSLAAAAVEPDPGRTSRMIEQAVRDNGIVHTWVKLAKPALSMIGKRGRTDRPGSDPEIVLADAVLAAVREVTSAAERSQSRRSTEQPGAAAGSVLLLAGPEGRMRGHVIGAGLVERGIGARMLRLGSEVVEQTRHAVGERRTRVLAVLGTPERAEEIVRAVVQDGDVEVFLLGTDTPELWLPRVHRVRTIRAAVDEIAETFSD